MIFCMNLKIDQCTIWSWDIFYSHMVDYTYKKYQQSPKIIEQVLCYKNLLLLLALLHLY